MNEINKNFKIPNLILNAFHKNKLNLENIHSVKDALLYLIEKNISFDIINSIKEIQNVQIFNTEDITDCLFHSVDCENFEIAKSLLKNGIDIENRNHESQTIFDYLINKNSLSSKKVSFVLKYIRNASKIITSDVLCYVISKEEINLIKQILEYKYIDYNYIKYFLYLYQNKKPVSNKELQHKLYYSNTSIIKINKKDKFNNSPLLVAIETNNIEKLKLILEYSNRNNINLNINSKDKDGYCPLLYIINKNNYEMVKLIIDYAIKNNIILKFNIKNRCGNYPFLWAIFINNLEIVQLIIDYAIKNNVILEVNEKDKGGNYPFLKAVKNNNLKMVQLIINYANENNITININDKNYNQKYPLLWAIVKNNLEMVELIVDYADKNNIILELNENDIENLISENFDDENYQDDQIKSISEINKEIIKELYLNQNKGRIKMITSNDNSELLKNLNEISSSF